MIVFHFLDVNIFRKNKKFATNVNRKRTFSGVFAKLGHYYLGGLVCALILSYFISRLINWKVYFIKTTPRII